MKNIFLHKLFDNNPPELYVEGTNPQYAANFPPFLNRSILSISVARILPSTNPTPGILSKSSTLRSSSPSHRIRSSSCLITSLSTSSIFRFCPKSIPKGSANFTLFNAARPLTPNKSLTCGRFNPCCLSSILWGVEKSLCMGEIGYEV